MGSERWPPAYFPSWGNIFALPLTSREPAEPQSLCFSLRKD